MDNVNSKDIENNAKKIDEKYADKAEDMMGYQEFKSAYTDAVEKSFHYKGMSAVEIDSRLIDKVNETYDEKSCGTDHYRQKHQVI